MKLPLFLCVLISSFWGSYVLGQGFNAAVLSGFNASQIDGDDLAGFNKLGLHGGLKLTYFIKPKIDLSTELLLSQRGSSESLSVRLSENQEFIQLNYLEIPIMITVHDWLIEESYFKVRAEFGFSYANLFNSSSQNSFFDEDISEFSSNDFSFLFGLGYRFSEKIGINVRYTRSINPLFENPTQLIRGLFGYFVTFRFEYHL